MIEDLKALLGLPEEIDGALENKLLLILKATKQRLRFLLGGLEPPEEMNYIILDVSIIRFNRIGSEGLSSHSVERVRRTDGEETAGSGAVEEEDLYTTVARNCFRYFGFTSFKQVGQLTLAEYELMMEALELRMLDESLHEHRQAFLNFAVKAEKKAGKGKTKPVYKSFRQFFDFDKELKKMKNRRKPSRFAGITKLLDREE